LLGPAGGRGVRQERVIESLDSGDVEPARPGRSGRPRAVVAGRPPSPSERGCGHDSEGDRGVDPQREEGRPHRYAADEVLGAVDRVDDPGAAGVAGGAGLLADDRVVRSFRAERASYRVLDRAVGVGDGGEVRLGLDEEVGGEESRGADRVGGVGERVRQREVVRPPTHGGSP